MKDYLEFVAILYQQTKELTLLKICITRLIVDN